MIRSLISNLATPHGGCWDLGSTARILMYGGRPNFTLTTHFYFCDDLRKSSLILPRIFVFVDIIAVCPIYIVLAYAPTQSWLLKRGAGSFEVKAWRATFNHSINNL